MSTDKINPTAITSYIQFLINNAQAEEYEAQQKQQMEQFETFSLPLIKRFFKLNPREKNIKFKLVGTIESGFIISIIGLDSGESNLFGKTFNSDDDAVQYMGGIILIASLEFKIDIGMRIRQIKKSMSVIWTLKQKDIMRCNEISCYEKNRRSIMQNIIEKEVIPRLIRFFTNYTKCNVELQIKLISPRDTPPEVEKYIVEVCNFPGKEGSYENLFGDNVTFNDVDSLNQFMTELTKVASNYYELLIRKVYPSKWSIVFERGNDLDNIITEIRNIFF